MIGNLIGVGSQMIGAGMNAMQTQRQNKQSQRWAEKTYDKQREHALQDWHMINEYNSPQAQMKRMQEAGLNPALMYGKGASAGQASSVSSTDTQTPQFRVPETGNFISSLASMYDFEIKQAQIDNLKAQNTNLAAEGLLKTAQAGLADFDLDFKKEFRQISGDALKENVRQLQTNTQYTLDKNQREAIKNDQDIKESAARIINMELDREKAKEAIEVMKKDKRLKQLDIELKEKGIQPHHSMFAQILARFLESTGVIPKLGKKLESGVMDYLFRP